MIGLLSYQGSLLQGYLSFLVPDTIFSVIAATFSFNVCLVKTLTSKNGFYEANVAQ